MKRIIRNRGKHAKRIHWMRVIFTLIFFILIILTPTIIHNFNESNSIIDSLQNDIETKDKTIEEYKTQNEDLINKSNDLQNNINELNNQINGLNEKVKTLETSKLEKSKTVTSRGGISRSNNTSNSTYLKFEATGYCSCSKCCGKSTGITASGTKASAGRTVAMSSQYKFGTKIEIKNMGTYTVEDRGGAIQGNRIDIYFNSHSEALKFGRKTVYLRVI